MTDSIREYRYARLEAELKQGLASAKRKLTRQGNKVSLSEKLRLLAVVNNYEERLRVCRFNRFAPEE